GEIDLHDTPLARLARCPLSVGRVAGMGGLIGGHEGLALLRRQMADAEDRLEMARGHRDGIDRIGDLGDEAAVLAERLGDLQAQARGAAVDILLQQTLIGGHRLVPARLAPDLRRVSHGARSRPSPSPDAPAPRTGWRGRDPAAPAESADRSPYRRTIRPRARSRPHGR